MSNDKDKINLIKNYLYPFKFTNNKTLIINFLNEVYANIYKRCNNNFDSYTFQEVINLPMIISDKIFYTLTEHQSEKISLNRFSTGIYDLFFDYIDNKVKLIFDIFDFDNDKIINKYDVFLLLSHFHLIENTTNLINLIENIINETFKDSNILSKDELILFCKNNNSDIFFLMIIFLNAYINLIRDNELKQYGLSMNYSKFENSSNKNENNNYFFDYNNLLEYKISNCLINYLSQITIHSINLSKIKSYINNNEKYEDDEEEEKNSISEDNEELEDLNNFENDFINIFGKLSKQQEKKHLFEIKNNNSVNYFNQNSFNSPEKYNKKKTYSRNKSNILYSPNTINLNNNEFKHATSLNYNLKNLFEEDEIEKKEIILFKIKNGIKTDKSIKLILVNYYIFYYKLCRGNFLFKKVIPVFSLYPKLSKSKDNIYLKFFSTVHNCDILYSFYNINRENNYSNILNFYNFYIKNCNYKDINSYYILKKELGKGKFGHVFLAERKSDLKEFSIKYINKKNPTEEEYKIYRWEATIFSTLMNIRNPNIIRTYQKFENDKNLFFVFEYVKGHDLKTYMKIYNYNNNINSTSNIINITMQILNGLNTLHKYGILHRDIKPTNIMVYDSNIYLNKTGKGNVKIIDFGLSKILGKYETAEESYGSLCFKCPELIRQIPYDFKIDSWNLGITIYYLIYKELPFEKGNKNQIKQSILSRNILYYCNTIISELNYIHMFNEKEFYSNSRFLFSIMKDCLEKKYENRLSIEELYLKYMDQYIKNYC